MLVELLVSHLNLKVIGIDNNIHCHPLGPVSTISYCEFSGSRTFGILCATGKWRITIGRCEYCAHQDGGEGCYKRYCGMTLSYSCESQGLEIFALSSLKKFTSFALS